MKTTNLEYTNIPVLLPDIDFFLNKIESNEPFHFIRMNHGIIDLIHLSYSDLSEFETSFLINDFQSIAEKMINASNIDINNPLQTYHNNSEKLKEKIVIFLQVLKEYKSTSSKLFISVSLGVGLHTYWGVWPQYHPYQLGRTNVWKIIDRHKENNFYYSGILKHYTIKNEIFKLFEYLNKFHFLVIFVGRPYMNLYKSIFGIDNFYHIEIPNKGAIEFVDDYIDEIKNVSLDYKNTIVLHSTGHIISFYIADKLINTNIFGLDIGRSFDLLVKHLINEHHDIPKCWITHLDEYGLNNYVNTIRK